MFKRLLPLCLGVNTIGLTAASKILFSIFPEIALPDCRLHRYHLFDASGDFRMGEEESKNAE
jgi:hypothetical protein